MTPSRDGASASRHIPALDGVRGLAILLVLCHQLYLPGSVDSRAMVALRLCLDAGWVGVQIFFVLSGYLITTILLESHGAPGYFRAFYARRALRIAPPYYALLAAAFIVVPSLGVLPAELLPGRKTEAWYWLYLQNWSFLGAGGRMADLEHTWSLAVEEQFYLVWPIAVAALGRAGLMRLCVGLCTLSIGLRAALCGQHADPWIIYEGTLTRVDALSLGALVAVVARDAAPRLLHVLESRVAWICVAVTLAVHVRLFQGQSAVSPANQTFGYTLYALVSAALILLCVLQSRGGGGAVSRTLAWAPLRVLGKYSYAMYLLHAPLHAYVKTVYVQPHLPASTDLGHALLIVSYTSAMTVLLLGLAMISWRYFEQPLLDLKRLVPVGSPTGGPANG